MFQRPQPHHNSTQPDVLPAAPSNPQKETQGSLPVLHNRRVSIQEPLLANSRWAGIQNTPSIISSRRVSTEDTAATISGHRVSIQDAPSVTFSRRFNTRDVPPIFEIRYFSIQNSPLTTRNSLSNRESVTYSSSQASSKNLRPTTWRSRLNIQGLTSPIRAKVDVPPSVTHSPTVPLRPPGHPDGSLTMPINTILFVRCPDISCLHEYDQNAYLLDLAWAFLLLASIASFCLCILLINIIFFTSSNSPMLDFSSVIVSILAGTALRFSPQESRREVPCLVSITIANPLPHHIPILHLSSLSSPIPILCPSKSPNHPHKKYELPAQAHL
ncbi:uncharacterized protein LOC109488373 isoform X4 [Ailuropoda melanoleuca]|uniref:uncharacterized protein LOC109488373 isoform X4 n=1 Tax=Ailuropoda melanoleuca TaxID=9646 RepID=UPI0009479FF5|nr:uncharacterized protein LOC109488373 isoform X4 [Ailuropoda melanoleuca]